MSSSRCVEELWPLHFQGHIVLAFRASLTLKTKGRKLNRRQTPKHHIPEDSTTAVRTSNLAENKLLVRMTGNAGPNAEYEFKGVLGQMRNKTGNVRINVKPKRVCRAKAASFYIFWECVCSFRYPACKAHAPYCHMWPVRLYDIFS